MLCNIFCRDLQINHIYTILLDDSNTICDLRNEINKIYHNKKQYELFFCGKLIINCTQTIKILGITDTSIVNILYYS